MKKSNILLLSALVLACCWTLLIGWFAASAINNYLQGKDPYFARTHHQYMENRKKCFPAPVGELCISGEGTAVITLLPGKELVVLSEPRIWNCVYTELKNGKSMISLKRLNEFDGPVTIMLPMIPSLTLDNFSRITIKDLDRKEIRLQCQRIQSFALVNCKIEAISLEFPRTRDMQDIYIDKSNHFGTFNASVQGLGKMRMETAGQVKNQIFLSDSIQVEATYDLMKKLISSVSSSLYPQ